MSLRPIAATALLIAAWSGHATLAETPAPEVSPAAAPAPSAGPAEDVAANDEDPIICRSQVETGTIGRKQKICMTKSQWEAQRQAARRYKRGLEQSRSTPPAGG